MFHMTNDSGLFRTRQALEEEEGAYPIERNCWRNNAGDWLPLYEGKMVQAFDHRAASIVINPDNQHRPASPEAATLEEHQAADWQPDPQYWVQDQSIPAPQVGWFLGFKDVTAPTNMRSMIAAMIPYSGVGNTFPILISENIEIPITAHGASTILGNLNAIIFDFVAR